MGDSASPGLSFSPFFTSRAAANKTVEGMLWEVSVSLGSEVIFSGLVVAGISETCGQVGSVPLPPPPTHLGSVVKRWECRLLPCFVAEGSARHRKEPLVGTPACRGGGRSVPEACTRGASASSVPGLGSVLGYRPSEETAMDCGLWCLV